MCPKVSILIPVYNVELYLTRCIDSVLSQDFQDWEMILVDDGSSDKCPHICDEYARNDKRIRVIHKSNGGVVSARLAGFEASVGKYLVFLDSDDFLLPNALSVLFRKIEEGYDLVRGMNQRITPSGNIIGLEPVKCSHGILSGEQYRIKYVKGVIAPYLWGAIYKRDLFSESIFKSFLAVSRQDDWCTQVVVALNVKKACLIDNVVLAYMINENSIMQTCVTDFKYADKIEHSILEIVKNSSEEYQKMLVACRMGELIKCFFIPELDFSFSHYEKVRKYLSIPTNYKAISEMIDNKFLKFISIRPLFYMYSRIYCILFRLVKLKGKKRKVLF